MPGGRSLHPHIRGTPTRRGSRRRAEPAVLANQDRWPVLLPQGTTLGRERILRGSSGNPARVHNGIRGGFFRARPGGREVSQVEPHGVLKPDTDPDQAAADSSISSASLSSISTRDTGRGPRIDTRDGARRRFAAMASLLADDSQHVWDGVRRQFEISGKSALPTLKRAARSRRALVRSRARTILIQFQKQQAIRRLVRYVAQPEFDLERGLFLLGRYHTADLDPRPFQRALDAMANEVARRARRRTDPLQRTQVLVEYLGQELDYGGSLAEFHHPDNIHLHCAIKRRAGMPLTLCAVYMFVARRAGLRVAALALPGHVMLRLYGDQRTLIVDPYHRGQTRSERDCKKYLDQNGLIFQGDWLADAPDRALFKRQLMNLVRSSKLRGLKREVRELTQVIRVIDRGRQAR